MDICFILPCSGRYPIGGFRIIYEYANRLTTKGHHVTLIHLVAPQTAGMSWIRYGKAWLQFIRDTLTGGYRPSSWFLLDSRVRTLCRFSLTDSVAMKSDVIIASAWQTAEGVARTPASAGQKFYFIQHFEDWNSGVDKLVSTWCLPLKKIVIASWLRDVAHRLGQEAAIVPNAIDHDFFNVTRPAEEREPNKILLQCHRLDWKGTMDAVKALQLLHERGFAVQLTLFGLKRPEDLGIDLPHRFVFNPPQTVLKALYNDHAIFIAPSWSEGWGLTPHEAGACGAALAVTDIDGHREFLTHEQSALMSPPKDPERLAENVQRLLVDADLRVRLAKNAARTLRRFDWAQSVSEFERVLSDGTS